ncbi:MAG: hypothetical protein R2754_10855 [Microthrixaceae bacterium]
MGVTMGAAERGVSFFLSKNDFWRFATPFPAGSPKVVGSLDISADSLDGSQWSVDMEYLHPRLRGTVGGTDGLSVEAWVSATDNVLVVSLESQTAHTVSVALRPATSEDSDTGFGEDDGVLWAERRFERDVSRPTAAATALRVPGGDPSAVVVEPGRPAELVLSLQSRFDSEGYRADAVSLSREAKVAELWSQHSAWWEDYWNRSVVETNVDDLDRFYWISTYVSGATSRDPDFPPGLFGTWVTTDAPMWAGDYHLNYNYSAPFYHLYSSNRIEQAEPYDQPLLDFMEKAGAYAEDELGIPGLYYPVGIGPKGFESTYGDPYDSGIHPGPGAFLGQKSNGAYAAVNVATRWRTTYDPDYASKIYPFVKGLADFWEAYVTWDDDGGRYVIEDDAVHELTAGDVNPIVSLALVRNTLDVAIEMSAALGVDEDRHEQWNHILDHLSEFPTQSRNGRTVFRLAERGSDWVESNSVETQLIYPGEAIGPDSPDELLEIARNTIEEKGAWNDGNGTNSFFPAAVRVGYDTDTILNALSEYVDNGWPNGFRADNPHGIENTSTVPNTINEMLMSSHGDVIRLFPVWPDDQPARFEHLRAWGAFLVSSSRSDEGAEFVRIESEQGRPVTMVNPWPGETVVLHREDGKQETLSGERFEFSTEKGEDLLLGPDGVPRMELQQRLVQREFGDR